MIVFGIVLLVLLGWGVVAPRSQWRLLKSWTYRNPAANEPSDATFAALRFVFGVAAAVVLVLMLSGGALTRG